MRYPDEHKIENDFTLPVPIMINSASQRDYPAIIGLWERSVRASHFFLPEDYLQRIKKLLPSILPAVKLFIHLDKDNKTITGFLGVSEEKIEMLFIHPDKRGQGIGSLLNKFAVEQLNTRKVDVNEQNEQAVGFYKKIGYKVVGRTEVDGLGKPFPLLQMECVK
jgi:putative acetyltransferase